MKKIFMVIGLVFLLFFVTSCEPIDEIEQKKFSLNRRLTSSYE